MERRKVQGGENVWRRRRNDNDFRSKNQSEKRKKLKMEKENSRRTLNTYNTTYNIQQNNKTTHVAIIMKKKKIQFSFLSLNPNTS